MIVVEALRDRVEAAFVEASRGLPQWPDTHPNRSTMPDEAYSRVTDAARWRVMARPAWPGRPDTGRPLTTYAERTPTRTQRRATDACRAVSGLERRGDAPGSVYVRGVRVAEDDGLLFSYNITKVDTKLRRALNRERSHVGRSAYTDRIKAILLAVESPTVLRQLVEDMAGFAKGATRDEVKWNDVAERVVRQLASADPDVVFVTAAQRWSHPPLREGGGLNFPRPPATRRAHSIAIDPSATSLPCLVTHDASSSQPLGTGGRWFASMLRR